MRILNGLFGWFQPRRQRCPNVLVDFSVKEAGIYLTIYNLSPHPACQLCIQFDQPLKYFNGCKDLSIHPIIQEISYLAPFKSIELFLDPIDIFFYHLKVDHLCIDWRYEDERGHCFQRQNIHDLKIYRNLPVHSRIEFSLNG